MKHLSASERAWGFSLEEYVEAYSLVAPRHLAEAEAKILFLNLDANPEFSVGGEDELFALLSMISASATNRITMLTGWSAEILRAKQEEATRLYRERVGQGPFTDA